MTNVSSPCLTVVTASFPPQVSGSPILLTNMLQEYPGKMMPLPGMSTMRVRPGVYHALSDLPPEVAASLPAPL